MSQQLQIPENKVAAELSRFAADGLLTAISVATWDRRKLYERSPASDRYWQAGYQLIEQAAAEEALRIGIGAGSALQEYLDRVHAG